MDERRVVILARSETYEGVERPGLGPEVPAETVARARELEAENDIVGLRRLLLKLGRAGIDGYDLVVLGHVAGSSWEYRGCDVVGRDGTSAILHRTSDEFDDRISPHGLFWNHHDAEAFLPTAEANAPRRRSLPFRKAPEGPAFEIVPVGRFRRDGITPGQAIHFSIGNEHNPSDPFGRVVLTISDDDRARLEHYSRMGDGTWTADVAPGVVDEIRTALARSRFPDFPPQPIPAGAAFYHLEVITDDDPVYAMIYDFNARDTEGVKDAVAILDGIAVQMSGNRFQGGTAADTAVTNVQPAD